MIPKGSAGNWLPFFCVSAILHQSGLFTKFATVQSVIEYPQQFFPVSGFLERVGHDFTDERHDREACVLDIDSGYVRNYLVYRLLRNDIVVFDQDMAYREAEYSVVAANPEGRFYLLKYLYAANRPLTCSFNGIKTIMRCGFLGYCNNFGNHEFAAPAGFEGRLLHLLVEHSFLKDYIRLESFRGSGLEALLFGECGDMLAVPVAPGPLRRRLDKIVTLLHQPASRPFDKLRMLTAVAEVLEAFFSLYMAEERYLAAGDAGAVALADSVAQYLRTCVNQPFPGLAYLSDRFAVSASTLKRQFKARFGMAPHRYFRQQQMEEAARLLAGGTASVAEVGYRLGFDSPGNFTRAFRQAFGTPPHAYRADAAMPK